MPWKFLEERRGSAFSGEWPTVPEMFDITARRFPARPCFTDFDPDKITRTYAEARRNCLKLASWIREQGVQKGDRVAVTGKNSSEWATVYLSALYAGCVIVPLDYGLRNEEIANLIGTASPRLVFVDEEKLAYFAKRSVGGAKVYSLSKKYPEIYAYNLVPAEMREPVAVSEHDTAAILFTSGTTGTPKGVVLSHQNLVADCYIAQRNLDVYPTDVFYALLPIHHSYTMLAVLIVAISQGSEVVFGKTMAVSKMLKELREGRITMLLGVPLLFNKLLAGILKGIREKGVIVYGVMKLLMGVSYLVKKLFGVNPGKKLFCAVLERAGISTVRVAICGGGPLAKRTFKAYQQLGIDFIQGYGLTETSPIIALNPIERFKVQSVGQFFAPYMDMKILEPNEDGIGEVAVKGPMVMQGYYRMPEESAAAFTADGYLKTGDLGWLDRENYLYLAGRAKNLIVTEGGKNVYPEEIENAFQLFTDVEQVTVQGYIMDKAARSEGIEALIYPSDELAARLGVKRADAGFAKAALSAIQETVDKVNRVQPPYSRISRVVVLETPLEMTTTKKVKRQYAFPEGERSSSPQRP